MSYFSILDSNLSFNHDSGLISTQVGLRANDCIETTGVEGVLIYGPYMPAKAGHHSAIIEYVEPKNSAVDFDGVFIDVVSNGYEIVPKFDVERLAKEMSDPGRIEFSFYLDIDVEALELRIFVSAHSSFAFTSINIANTELDKKIESAPRKICQFNYWR